MVQTFSCVIGVLACAKALKAASRRQSNLMATSLAAKQPFFHRPPVAAHTMESEGLSILSCEGQHCMSATEIPAAQVRRDNHGLPIVNDFSIQVATVNGSGSQTANMVLMRSLFQMGIPISGKNLFPSNIAGLPTWLRSAPASTDG